MLPILLGSRLKGDALCISSLYTAFWSFFVFCFQRIEGFARLVSRVSELLACFYVSFLEGKAMELNDEFCAYSMCYTPDGGVWSYSIEKI